MRNEKRAEAYVSVGRELTSTLHLDGGIRYETSTLKVRGDAIADRSLSFWKLVKRTSLLCNQPPYVSKCENTWMLYSSTCQSFLFMGRHVVVY